MTTPDAVESGGGPVLAKDEVRRVELELPEPLYRRALNLASRERWPQNEALLTVLSHGIAHLEGERRVGHLNSGGPDGPAEAERLARRAMELDGAYSVMKFRAFRLQEAVEILEMNVSGLRGENRLAKHRLASYEADEARLKAELAELRRVNERLRARLDALAGDEAPAESAPDSGLCARLRRRLLGKVSP